MLDKLFPEYEPFRLEVRRFIADHYPSEMRVPDPYGELSKHDLMAWQRALHAKGWVAPHWPKQYGGAEWSVIQRYIWQQELAAAETQPLLAFGLAMVGPVIYTFGNEAQKAHFLPRILSADDWWCQGYSEPGAGSDLANVRTRAVRDGDHYIVNGHKTWTTMAQYADWIFALVRTDPDVRPQMGISFLLIDMKSPGVSVSPIKLIDGSHEVNDVFFDNVRVPVDQLIGEENKGWTYAKFLLGHERTNLAGTARTRAAIERLKLLPETGTPPFSAAFSRRIAQLEIDLMALESAELAMLIPAEKGHAPGPEASLLKIRGTELYQQATSLTREAAGPDALVARASSGLMFREFAPSAVQMSMQEYLNARKRSIYGGSNEIQHNIIANLVLGL